MTTTTRSNSATPRSNSALRLFLKFALVVFFAFLITAPTLDFSTGGDAFAQRRRNRDRDRDDPPPPARTETPAPAPAAGAAPLSPAINASTPFGGALASCDQTHQEDAQFGLPGLKGEIKLDRCYRGRRHLACRIDTVLTEGKSLTDEYTRIVDARYQEVTNLADVCKIDLDALVKDAAGATEFAKRFAQARAEYDVRTACAGRIKTSIGDVTLPELTQAPEVLKSMMDAVEGEITRVSTAHKQVADLAGKMEASHKSILVLQKIHRAMCMAGKGEPVKASTGAATGTVNQAASKDAPAK